MKRNFKERYITKVPIGVYPLTNTAELLFYLPDDIDNEYNVIIGMIIGEIDNSKNEFRPYKFHYNLHGEPFVIWKGNRIYLSEVERVM